MQQWCIQKSQSDVQHDTNVMAKASVHTFADLVALQQGLHQTSLLTYIAFLDGRPDGWRAFEPSLSKNRCCEDNLAVIDEIKNKWH